MQDVDKAPCAHTIVRQGDDSSETWKIAGMAHQMSHADDELPVTRSQLTASASTVAEGRLSIGRHFRHQSRTFGAPPRGLGADQSVPLSAPGICAALAPLSSEAVRQGALARLCRKTRNRFSKAPVQRKSENDFRQDASNDLRAFLVPAHTGARYPARFRRHCKMTVFEPGLCPRGRDRENCASGTKSRLRNSSRSRILSA